MINIIFPEVNINFQQWRMYSDFIQRLSFLLLNTHFSPHTWRKINGRGPTHFVKQLNHSWMCVCVISLHCNLYDLDIYYLITHRRYNLFSWWIFSFLLMNKTMLQIRKLKLCLNIKNNSVQSVVFPPSSNLYYPSNNWWVSC